MSANVETMFYTREKPWHGLGVRVNEAPTSKEALILAGLDWNVTQRPVLTDNGILIDGYKANIRDTDEKILGVVTDRYTVVQNRDAFAFTDELLGEGVCYETAGSLQEGKRTWMLAQKLIEDIKIRYFETPDLKHVEKNAYRFINAVSDFATHGKPLRETVNYKENFFARTIQGNALIDKAYEMVRAIA